VHEPVLTGSFREDFKGEGPRNGSSTSLEHPVHGDLGHSLIWPVADVVEVGAGAFMLRVEPVSDCTVSTSFQHRSGGDPECGVFVALFARCRDDDSPYAMGCAYEWDMRDAKERLWANGRLLAQRDRKGDGAMHTLSFALRGRNLRGSIDGGPPLEASGADPSEGTVGFGAHGTPAVVFDWFQLDHAKDPLRRPTYPVDAGARFDLLDDFAANAPGRDNSQSVSNSSAESIYRGDFGPHAPWYIVAAPEYENRMIVFHREGPSGYVDTLAFSNVVLCPIDSKRARTCTVRALTGDLLTEADPKRRYSDVPNAPRRGTSLLVRVQDPERPWAGCYCLSYDWAARRARLLRYEQSGPPDTMSRREPVPVRAVTLATAVIEGGPRSCELWVQADGRKLVGGLGHRALLRATDDTFPTGFVGYGARPDAVGVFRWVRMQGAP